MSIQKFLQDVSYDNICQEAMQALSTDIKFDIDVTIPILKIAYLRICQKHISTSQYSIAFLK